MIPPRPRDRKRFARRLALERLESRALLTAIDLHALAPEHHGHHDHRHDDPTIETHLLDGVPHLFVRDSMPPGETDEAGEHSDSEHATYATSLYPLTAIPVLNSNPGATAQLYLDFDGHFEPVWGAYNNVTNPAYDVDGDESTFTDHELANIVDIWKAVSEDYSAFNINVSTVEPAVLAPGVPIANANRVALRVAIGGTPDILGMGGGLAGYAYISVFTNSIANVAYVMPASFTTRNLTAYMGSIISHEAGHAFGLQHQSDYDANGQQIREYSNGDGETWSPIMGSLSSTRASIWHNGPNKLGPTNYQDDMAILAGSNNGFGYRADDHSNTTSGATILAESGGNWSGSGRIGTNTDSDVFRFTIGVEDTYRIAVTGAPIKSDLDAVLELRSSSGQLLATADPADSRSARIVRNLTPGDYYLTVKKIATYGWVGQYDIAIDTPPAGITVQSPAPMSTAEDGRSVSFTVALDTMPHATVTIPVSSTNSAEGIVSTSSLVFDSSNWSVPQTVTVSGVADGVVDNDIAYLVALGAAVSADPDYSGRDAADLNLVNIDVDTPGSLYRVDTLNDAIARSRLDGSQPEALVDLRAVFGDTANYNPRVIAHDPVEGRIYWNDATTDTIYRAHLDGSGAEVVVTLPDGGLGLALDPVGRKLYWPQNGAGLRRANLDGSNPETVFTLDSNSFRSVAVDPINAKLYFTDTTADVIRRTNLDGSSPEVLWSSSEVTFNGHIALDAAAGKMYWTDPGLNAIFRADLDGSNVEPLVDFTAYPRVGTGSTGAMSYGLALDLPAGKMYWTDFVSKTLYRADLDGSKVVLLASDVTTDGLLVLPPVPAVIVSPRSGLVTTEAGGTATFSVSLATQPTANVTIPVSTGDPTEGTVSTTLLTFTPANWNLPQVVTITGVDDAVYDLDVAYPIFLGAATSADPAYNGLDPADVAVTNTDNDPPPTKFYVVDDGSPDRTYEYGSTGSAVENYGLGSGNTSPRGAASTAAGDRVWVVDANKKVYVYDTAGTLLGSWTAGSLASNATVEGIATNGTDVWIVDARQDRVYRYTGAATRLSGSQNAASNFALNSGNRDPKGITTNGSHLWVINNNSTDKVFKYTTSGSLVGSWTITGAGSSPTGITLDPAAVDHLWIVDSGTDRVYQFDDATARASGSQSPSSSFALTAGNTNPQGIADPPVGQGLYVEETPGRSVKGGQGPGGNRPFLDSAFTISRKPDRNPPLWIGNDQDLTNLAIEITRLRTRRQRASAAR
jgi:hypothetical protein